MIVYRASRLEALLEPLLHLLDAQLPDDVLAPQQVIAAHPGMRQWLAAALARRRGPAGIVANLDIQLPSGWLEACAREQLGEPAVALQAWRRERLRWRLHALLEAPADPELAAYLRGPNPALLRYQLADRLAALFGQYLVYRPDWLAAWQAGREPVADAGFQPGLWRQLREEIGSAHRAELLERLIARLERGAGTLPGDPLHVFGVSHLAPVELRLLSVVARRRPVVLYVPDPCSRYWAGLPGDAARRRALAAGVGSDAASEAGFLAEVGHPLLARWGRMGQHFLLALEAGDSLADVRHWQDELPDLPGAPTPLLARVQESIRQFDPALAAGPARADDASLRVHLCHTRLRELEVLRDALLDARSAQPDLSPADIVVMAPDIAAYVPLLGAVFGRPGDPAAPLPYHLADVAVARAHPLFTAFSRLLAIPQARISAPEVIDLLQVPHVAAALGIDAAGVETLERWLQRAGVTWGLDAAFRQRAFDMPAVAQYTFASGIERLLAGYVFGQDTPERAVALPQPDHGDARVLWPVDGVHGPSAALLGALDRLLLSLAALHRDTAAPRRASAWSTRLLALLEGLFRVDLHDRDAREALAQLRAMLEALAQESADAGDPELDFSVVRAWLEERLGAVSERQQLLMGGITVCGMVPQRAIPFRVVAVLGLNDGEFPRRPNTGGLDLMARPGQARLGDRDVRSDDRYLFLETVMSARERLHLSYLGEGVQDGKPRNPAAPLADLLEFLDQATGLAGVAAAHDDQAAAAAEDRRAPSPAPLRPWRIRHPLQPFDPRYFDGGDPRLFSFDQALADARSGTAVAPAFLARRDIGEAESAPALLPLRSVLAWFRDPARQLLGGALQLRLDALEESRLAEDEPLDGKLPAVERLPRRLVLDALLGDPRCALPLSPPPWLALGGLLPPGRLGEHAWQTARADAEKLLAQAACLPGPLRRRSQPVAWAGSITGVVGEVTDVLVHGEDATRWVFEALASREAELDFRRRVPLFLRWALLRLASEDACDVRACLLLADDKVRTWRDGFDHWCARFRDGDDDTRAALRAELGRRVDDVLALYAQAQRETLWYFPKTAWAACADGADPHHILRAWTGDDHHRGERDYAPGYAALLARDTALDDAQVLAGLQQTARRLDRAMRLDRAFDAVAAREGVPA